MDDDERGTLTMNKKKNFPKSRFLPGMEEPQLAHLHYILDNL